MNQHKPSSTSNNSNTVEYWEEKTNSLDEQEVIDYENEEEVEDEELSTAKIEYEDPTSTGQQQIQQQSQQRATNSISKIIKPTVINDDVLGPIIDHLLTEVKSSDKDNPDWSFFKSLMPDVAKLTAKRRRKFKEIVLTNLNKLLEEDEIESDEFVSQKEIFTLKHYKE